MFSWERTFCVAKMETKEAVVDQTRVKILKPRESWGGSVSGWWEWRPPGASLRSNRGECVGLRVFPAAPVCVHLQPAEGHRGQISRLKPLISCALRCPSVLELQQETRFVHLSVCSSVRVCVCVCVCVCLEWRDRCKKYPQLYLTVNLN